MNNKIIIRQVPPEKLQDFQIKMVGDKKCVEQLIIINGLKFGFGAGEVNMGKGIGKIDIVLEPSEKPKVFVEYHPHLVTKEVCEVLGIEKLPSYQKGN